MKPEDKVWAVTAEDRKNEDIPGKEPTVRIHASKGNHDKSTVIGSRPDYLTVNQIAPPNRAESVVASYGKPQAPQNGNYFATAIKAMMQLVSSEKPAIK